MAPLLGTEELMELEQSSWFGLVSSPESVKTCKATALRHGFVHLSETDTEDCAAMGHRRSRSAEPRCEADAEAIAFTRYVSTFHFGWRRPPQSPGDGTAQTPTGARQKLAELVMPARISGCGMPVEFDANERDFDNSQPVSAVQTPLGSAYMIDAVATPVDSPRLIAAFETPLGSPRSVIAIETPLCSPRPLAATTPMSSPWRSNIPTAPTSPTDSPLRMRADAPAFVPQATRVRADSGPLSTLPPSTPGGFPKAPPSVVPVAPVSPQAYSFLNHREAGTRMPPLPPPSSPPPPMPSASLPGAFHMPPPRGLAGCNMSQMLHLQQHIPLPPTTSPKLTYTLLGGVEKREHEAFRSPQCRWSLETDSNGSHSDSTTAPPSGEEPYPSSPLSGHQRVSQQRSRGSQGAAAHSRAGIQTSNSSGNRGSTFGGGNGFGEFFQQEVCPQNYTCSGSRSPETPQQRNHMRGSNTQQSRHWRDSNTIWRPKGSSANW